MNQLNLDERLNLMINGWKKPNATITLFKQYKNTCESAEGGIPPTKLTKQQRNKTKTSV